MTELGVTPLSLPPTKAVRDLLEGLLGRPVTTDPHHPWMPAAGQPVCVAEMVGDDGLLLAVALLDLGLTVHAGAAIGLAPPGGARDMVAEQDPSPTVLANTAEVLNVLSSVWNVPNHPHTRLGTVHEPGSTLPPHVARVLTSLGRRTDLRVGIGGYGDGLLTLLAA